MWFGYDFIECLSPQNHIASGFPVVVGTAIRAGQEFVFCSIGHLASDEYVNVRGNVLVVFV